MAKKKALKPYRALHRIHRESGEIIEKGGTIDLDPASAGVPLLLARGRIEPIEDEPEQADEPDGQE